MKRAAFIFLFLLLLYTRFVGLDWGLPYPMHPDERNMANAIQRLNCEFSVDNIQLSDLKACLNPHFFAYGQFPLYISYASIQLIHVLSGTYGQPILFTEAAISLRVFSAVWSVFTAFILVKILELILPKKKLKYKNQDFFHQITNYKLLVPFLIFIFSSYAIQFSHFGTTESLLMMLYSIIVYYSLRITVRQPRCASIFLLSAAAGLAIAVKVSSVSFMAVPFLAWLYIVWIDTKTSLSQKILCYAFHVIRYTALTALFTLILSPQSAVSLNEFLGSMRYESDVALGVSNVFYTRQFEYTTPILFQLEHIFPYALGLYQFGFAALGFFFLSWKDKKINILRLAFLLYFIPTAFLYAKWTRFMSPIFPIATVFAILALLSLFRSFETLASARARAIIMGVLVVLVIAPGAAYLSIYQNPDVRFRASDWIFENIPDGSYILSETANVVDIPVRHAVNNQHRLNRSQQPARLAGRLANSNYRIISFDFYHLDRDPVLQESLKEHLQEADYIFVPSRRLFANHTCSGPNQTQLLLRGGRMDSSDGGTASDGITYESDRCKKLQQHYPLLNDYYDKLFSGELARPERVEGGFEKVAEFTSYPRISLFGKKLFEFPDEGAEETWTVFDHPVVRIYKRLYKMNESS